MTTTPDAECAEQEGSVPQKTAAERRCLHCGTLFQSQWVGERVCRRCKDSANWREGASGYTPDG